MFPSKGRSFGRFVLRILVRLVPQDVYQYGLSLLMIFQILRFRDRWGMVSFQTGRRNLSGLRMSAVP